MQPAPRPPLRGPIARVLSAIYGAEIARRNRRFDAGRRVITMDRPVLSVGNLSVGGTGKTPMVEWIVSRLQEDARRPCIAMRGYRAHAGRSDEAEAYRRALPGVPVVAQPNRVDGLIRLFAKPEGARVDCIVLDDGFQHRRLARQFDLVLVDASRDPFADRLLPAGWLREPVDSLRRATAVVLTHAELVSPSALSALEARIRDVHGAPPLAVVRHDWADVREGDRNQPLTWLAGKRVVAVCAIGNPGAFIEHARRAAARPPVAEIVLRDHDPYGPATVRRIIEAARAADAVITTEKDWSRLRDVPAARWPCPVVRPRLVFGFLRGQAELSGAILAAAALRPE